MNFTGNPKKLTAANVAEEAERIGVPVATIWGVADVEAAGSGFDKQGRPLILFEPHRFYAELGAGPKRDRAVEEGVAYRRWGEQPYPKSNQGSYDRLAKAMAIDETAALKSASWGLFQIMGSEHKIAGFRTVQDFVYAMVNGGEDAHLDAFMKVVAAYGLNGALQKRDGRVFARRYNGPGFAKNSYDVKLAAAWKRRDKSPKVARPAEPAVPIDARVPPPIEKPAAAPAPQPASEPEVKSDEPDPIDAGPLPQGDVDDPRVVEWVQARLRELGYFEVGMVDGDLVPGGRAEAAILAFRNTVGLPLKPTIDQQLLGALARAQPRPVSETRKNATEKDLLPESRIVKKSVWNRLIGWVLGVPAALTAAVNGVVENFGDMKDQIEPVREFFGSIPPWVWAVGVGVAAFMVWRNSKKIADARVQMHREARVL